MKRVLLSAPAWKVFAFLLGIPIAVALLAPHTPQPVILLIVGTLVYGVSVFYWFWSIASASNDRLPASSRASTKLMAGGLIYALGYVLTLLGYLAFEPEAEPGALLLIPHVLAMLAIFYALWLTASQITALKNQGNRPFWGTLGRFFLLWYFPIGVWFIQPFVRRTLGAVSA